MINPLKMQNERICGFFPGREKDSLRSSLYLFPTVNKIRHAGEDIVDLGMKNPDMPTPGHIVDKLVEASRKGVS